MTKYKLPKIEELLDAGVHFGHQVRRWHPKMEPYIFTVKKNIHIIDLEQTEEMLKKACAYLYETAKNGGQIIFVGTKKQARDIVEIEAKRSGALYVTERWIGGTITNYRVIKKNIDKLLTLVKRRETGDLDKYTKKERLLIDREIDKLQKYVGGITALRGAPAALFIIDPRREKTAIREANRYGVSVGALIDTNSDPTGVSCLVPGNDDAIKSVALILKTISDAVLEGYREFEKGKTSSQEEQKEVIEQTEEPSAILVTESESPKVTEEIAEKLEKEVDEVVVAEKPKEIEVIKIAKKPRVKKEKK